ncbi:hypothetical protein GGR56DRAFT_101161 [Xylariaceae sp. FL0804]|nr:hypothetical protein GGR56DRAFT_101161 [Xylariaceae sp. FL0804]
MRSQLGGDGRAERGFGIGFKMRPRTQESRARVATTVWTGTVALRGPEAASLGGAKGPIGGLLGGWCIRIDKINSVPKVSHSDVAHHPGRDGTGRDWHRLLGQHRTRPALSGTVEVDRPLPEALAPNRLINNLHGELRDSMKEARLSEEHDTDSMHMAGILCTPWDLSFSIATYLSTHAALAGMQSLSQSFDSPLLVGGEVCSSFGFGMAAANGLLPAMHKARDGR